MTPIKRFGGGLKFIFEGTRVIFSIPGVFIWALLPFIIDVILIVVGISLGWGQVAAGAAWAVSLVVGTATTGVLYAILYYPLMIFSYLVFIGLLVYVTFLLSTIVASPFNSILSEKILMHYGAVPVRPFQFRRWLAMSVKMVWVSTIRAVIFGLLGIVIFVLSFVPVLNIGASFVAFLIIAFDCMDYSLEVMELDFKQRIAYFRDQFPEFAGMASILGLTLLIPGLTLLLLPSSVAGAAVLAAHKKVAPVN